MVINLFFDVMIIGIGITNGFFAAYVGWKYRKQIGDWYLRIYNKLLLSHIPVVFKRYTMSSPITWYRLVGVTSFMIGAISTLVLVRLCIFLFYLTNVNANKDILSIHDKESLLISWFFAILLFLVGIYCSVYVENVAKWIQREFYQKQIIEGFYNACNFPSYCKFIARIRWIGIVISFEGLIIGFQGLLKK